MMAAQKVSAYQGERKRYVKVPETRDVKAARDLWLRDGADVDPLVMVHHALRASHRLTIGRFKNSHWYATIVSDVERPDGWPNALSGWGETPAAALSELGFRWHICMQGSWLPEAWNLRLVPVLVREQVAVSAS